VIGVVSVAEPSAVRQTGIEAETTTACWPRIEERPLHVTKTKHPPVVPELVVNTVSPDVVQVVTIAHYDTTFYCCLSCLKVIDEELQGPEIAVVF
jgi:hypothetical protein